MPLEKASGTNDSLQTQVSEHMRFNSRTGKTSFVRPYQQRKKPSNKKEIAPQSEFQTQPHKASSSTGSPTVGGEEPLLIYPNKVQERVQDVVTEFGYKNRVVDVFSAYDRGIQLLIPKLITETKPTIVNEDFKSYKNLAALINKLRTIDGMTAQAIYSNLNIEKELVQFIYRLDQPTEEIAESVKELFNNYFEGQGLVAEFDEALKKIPIFRESMLAGLVLPIDYDYIFTLPQALGDHILILRIKALTNILHNPSVKFSFMVTTTSNTQFFRNRVKSIVKNADLLNPISLVRVNLLKKNEIPDLQEEIKTFGLLTPNQMAYFLLNVLTYQQGDKQNARN